MPDVFTKAKRSAVMARIRSRGNARTELALVRVFRALGITGWRRHIPLPLAAPGSRDQARKRKGGDRVRPDFVFPRRRVAVFVDGCFWHGCPAHATRPKANAAFWRRKLAANLARDQRVTRALRRGGWRVLRLWEHELRRQDAARLDARLRRWFGGCARAVNRRSARRPGAPARGGAAATSSRRIS